ncbi:hypothetical protein BD408DRAFT_434362 [Parasitella parasitica]|nr:hypothetical protein BD408DRAFT_434362 [Parasitella parasitica]
MPDPDTLYTVALFIPWNLSANHPLESNISGLEQDLARTASLCDSGDALLAECSVVPSSFPSLHVTTTSGTDNITQDAPFIDTTELDALRVETFKHRLQKTKPQCTSG